MQKIKFEVAVEIPSHLVLVEKSEYEALKEQKNIGRWWTMQDLEEYTNMKRDWLKEHVLYVPKYKKQIEKFVNYPQRQGEKWSFQATKMAHFLEDNFYQIFKG